MIVVNGPMAKKIGMNSGINALGQGNRANATIGRALNLIVRNVGGGRPGEADRATLGAPSKFTLCFAEDEWDPSSRFAALGRTRISSGASTVTLFQGHGVEAFVDQKTRTPEGLSRSFGLSLVKIGHPRLVQSARAVVVLSEHYRIYKEAGWDRKRIERALYEANHTARERNTRRLDGIGEGVPKERGDEAVPKFHDDGLMVVRAGGHAGLFSAILPGWLGRSNKRSCSR